MRYDNVRPRRAQIPHGLRVLPGVQVPERGAGKPHAADIDVGTLQKMHVTLLRVPTPTIDRVVHPDIAEEFVITGHENRRLVPGERPDNSKRSEDVVMDVAGADQDIKVWPRRIEIRPTLTVFRRAILTP